MIKEELRYFQAQKREAIKKLSSNWKELISVLLERAFTEGYRAKHSYIQKRYNLHLKELSSRQKKGGKSG